MEIHDLYTPNSIQETGQFGITSKRWGYATPTSMNVNFPGSSVPTFWGRRPQMLNFGNLKRKIHLSIKVLLIKRCEVIRFSFVSIHTNYLVVINGSHYSFKLNLSHCSIEPALPSFCSPNKQKDTFWGDYRPVSYTVFQNLSIISQRLKCAISHRELV